MNKKKIPQTRRRSVRAGARRHAFHGLCTLLLTAFVAMQPALWNAEPAAARATVYNISENSHMGRLRITVQKSDTIEVDESFAEVLVGDPEIADVLPMTNHTIYILGKQVGSTNVAIYNKSKELIGVLDLEVAFDVAGVAAAIKQSVNGAHVKVASVNGRLLLNGTVPDAPALTKVLNLANQFAPNAVSNALSVGSPQQVMLEVRFVEASRSAGRELGIRWDVAANRFIAATAPPGFGLVSGAVPFGAIVGSLLSGGVNADIIIDALEEKGLARRLAEPNLVALSGETASFLAGGEFPIPVGAEDNQIRIEFKKFGVGLSFTPTVLSGGLINLEIEPEVSQLDPNNTLRLLNAEIPGLIVRRAQTTVELRDGQSFAIAGLLQSDHSKATAQLPWIGSVPVIGALFKSSSFQKEETDLVIIVTPRLVRPASPDQQLATPFDNSRPGNDVDFFLMGDMEVSNDVIGYFESGGEKEGPFGHIIPMGSRETREPEGKISFFSGNGVRRYNDK